MNKPKFTEQERRELFRRWERIEAIMFRNPDWLRRPRLVRAIEDLLNRHVAAPCKTGVLP